MPVAPQEWELSAKQEIDPNRLIRNQNDQLGKVFVGFALAFNDLKGLVLLEQYLAAMERPAADDWTERAGQWRGISVQIHRWIAGVIHELMVLIQKNRHLVQGAEMGAIVDTLPQDSKPIWEQLVAAALNTTGAVATLLNRIRNNAAFHYGANDLGIGYRRQFVEQAQTAPHVINQSAQYSYGPDMDGTRFYFADAAVQQRMKMLGLEFGAVEADTRIVELAAEVNEVLAPLIVRFIRVREAAT